MPRKRINGDGPPMTSAQRKARFVTLRRAEGKTELRGVFLGEKSRERLKWLQAFASRSAGRQLTQSEIVVDALRFTFDHAADDGTKPAIGENQ